MGMAQRMAKQWRKEKRSMTARSVEEDEDRPVLCSSQVDSLSVARVRTSGVSQGGCARGLSIIDNVFSVSVRTAQ